MSWFAADLTELIWEFNSFTSVYAVDYHLGLLAEVLGEVDEAIDLHYAALEQHRSAGYTLDVGYSSWQLHRLLTKRNATGDLAAAQATTDDAIDLLAPTPFSRIKRLIDDELRITVADLTHERQPPQPRESGSSNQL